MGKSLRVLTLGALAVALLGCGPSTGPGEVETGTYQFTARTYESEAARARTYGGTANISRVTGESLYVAFTARSWPTKVQVGTFNVDAYRLDVELADTSVINLGGTLVTSVGFTNVVLRISRSGSGVRCTALTYSIKGSGAFVNGAAACDLVR